MQKKKPGLEKRAGFFLGGDRAQWAPLSVHLVLEPDYLLLQVHFDLIFPAIVDQRYRWF